MLNFLVVYSLPTGLLNIRFALPMEMLLTRQPKQINTVDAPTHYVVHDQLVHRAVVRLLYSIMHTSGVNGSILFTRYFLRKDLNLT